MDDGALRAAALEAESNQDWELALRLWSELLSHNEAAFTPVTKHVAALIRLGQFEEAERRFQRAKERWPGDRRLDLLETRLHREAAAADWVARAYNRAFANSQGSSIHSRRLAEPGLEDWFIAHSEEDAVDITADGIIVPPLKSGFLLARQIDMNLPPGLASIQLRLRSKGIRELQERLRDIQIQPAEPASHHITALFGPDLLLIDDELGELELTAKLEWPAPPTRCAIVLRLKASRVAVNVTSARASIIAAGPSAQFPALISDDEIDQRPSVAVIGSERAGNGAGRMHILADLAAHSSRVQIFSPTFTEFGGRIWAPLANTKLPWLSFQAAKMRDFVPEAARFANSISCDAAIISKPRLPGLLLGLLVHHRLGCPLVLDIDDWELAFISGAKSVSLDELAREAPKDHRPLGRLWSSVAHSLIYSITNKTAPSLPLVSHFGALMVRHARDEQIFKPDSGVRAQVRAEFGVDEHETVILFLGTPRAHKGLTEIVEALERLGDERLRLVVIGTSPEASFGDRLRTADAKVSLHPDSAWERLPELLQLADGVCLLQDPEALASTYQIPAKLTDALSMGLPTAVTDVPPMRDTPDEIAAKVRSPDDLDDWLRKLVAGEWSGSDQAQRRRAWFLQEFGFGVNAARLELALSQAASAPRHWNEDWTTLFRLLNRYYKTASLPETPPSWASGSA